MKVKVFAKINLTLDVVGKEGDYHLINSFCTPINLSDVLTVKKRKDNNITVKEKGILSGVAEKDNNAYKTAKLFMETFNTKGVDIVIDKSIFVGAGLGGSSADIAGVLIAMQKLFKVNKSVLPIANALGSDVAVMLYGNQAVISGRGETVTPIKNKVKLNGVLIYSGKSVSAKEAYAKFDKIKKKLVPATEKVVKKVENGDESFVLDFSNHLEPSVSHFNLDIKENIGLLKSLGAINALMTGSGSAVYGIFKDKKQAKKVYKKLKPKFGDNAKIIKTL